MRDFARGVMVAFVALVLVFMPNNGAIPMMLGFSLGWLMFDFCLYIASLPSDGAGSGDKAS